MATHNAFVQSKSEQQAGADVPQSARETEDEWKTVLQTVLRLPNAQETLAVVLFLLDTLAFLRSMIDASMRERDDRSEVVLQFMAYLRAMYICPVSDATATTLASSLRPSLFHIPRSILPSLAQLMDAQDGGGLPDTEAETSLRLASVEALRWLQQAKDGDGQLLMKQAPSSSASLDSGPPHEARDPDHDALEADSHLVVDTSIDFSTLPTPNRLLQATLRRALAESQASRASSPSTPIRPVLRKSSVLPIDVGVQRWALSSLLHHYLGEDFGQMRKDDGVTSYARDERDDLAIRELFPDPRRFSVVEGEGIPSSPSTASVAHAQQAGVPALQAELRRDDKLKWLLGETVASQTVRRTSPLPGPLASSSQSKPRTRKNRMVARSPTASEPRRRIFNHQNWLSEADSQEMVHARTRTSSASSEPLSPPHRRAWSADSDLSSLKLHGTYIQDRDNDSNKNRAYARQSFDTTSSNAEWRGGVSLSRIDSYETYNSQSHLIRPGHDVNEALERFPALSRTFGDTLLEHPTKALPMSGLLDTPQSSRPFTNLSAVGPWYDSMQPLNSSSAAKGLPSTSNELSAREKQHLIRKGRKLKAILGTEVQEESVDRGVQVSRSEARNIDTLSSPRAHLLRSHSSRSSSVSYLDGNTTSVTMARAASVPLDSSQQGSRLSRSQSLGSAQYPKPRSNSVAGYRIDTIQLSPIAASFVSSDDGSVTSPIAIVQRAPRTEADIAREARRRKLLKIQAFLGERVPASAIKDVAGVIGQPLKPTRGVPMFSKASSRLHRRLTKSKRVNVPLSDHESDWRQSHRRRLEIDTENPASLSMDERSRRISQTSDSNAEDVRPPGVALFSNSRAAHGLMGRGSQFFDDPSREDIGKAAEPVILAVRRARKLEKVFGSLPPAQLYARMNKWVPRQDDFASDNLSVRSKVSRGSLQRARIASIRFIAESEDPDLVEDFARVVLSQESDASDVENAAVGLSSLVDNAAFEMRHASQARRDRADAAADSDDPEHEEEGSEELLGVQADKSITDRQPSFDSETRSTGDHSRSSRDTGSSHALHQANDLHIRLGLSGASSPAGTDLFNQRYDRSKVRKTRDSILSAATAHSSVGSAYVVDPFGRPQRSHSRASPSTSVEGGTPRSSMDSVRLQFKRAHKLATVFGTTRGEVFNRVLDDIEADIAEADDEEMDEEERKEIIESVTALRASL